MKSLAQVRASWLAHLHSTAPVDRTRAEAAVRALYAAAGFPEPRHFFWFDSPCAASWAVAALVPKADVSSSQLLAPNVLSVQEREQLERVRTSMREQLGLASWSEVVSAVGQSRSSSMETMANPGRLFGQAFLEARFAMVDDVSALFNVPGDDDDLARAEQHFWGPHWGVLNSGLHCHPTNFLIRTSFVDEHPFSQLADDEHRAGDRDPPAILRAALEIAKSTGLWWPYDGAAIMADRPAEVHVNERHVPHREDGPAVVFRDGWDVYAWNGKAVPRQWIMEPGTVPPREYKGFDSTYGKWAKSRSASSTQPAGAPAAATRKKPKAGSILKAPLPADPAARLEQLRAHTDGKLPLFDRYQAGEHRQVWTELVALGSAVRDDPYAADALAVAYETMRRVRANVETLVQRLTAMGYVFQPDGPSTGPANMQIGGMVVPLSRMFGMLMKATGKMASQPRTPGPNPGDTAPRAHVPPGPNARKEVADFEKEYAMLPLSLRAFYEVVGEVNLNGTHPLLDPKDNPVAPDPLIVYGLDEGIVELDEDDEEGERPAAVTIAPDDLHKANTSGGDAYAMAIPDARADGELLHERHGVFFVDYLRLCFEYGGFPGYEGRATAPAELQHLKAGLLEL